MDSHCDTPLSHEFDYAGMRPQDPRPPVFHRPSRGYEPVLSGTPILCLCSPGFPVPSAAPLSSPVDSISPALPVSLFFLLWRAGHGSPIRQTLSVTPLAVRYSKTWTPTVMVRVREPEIGLARFRMVEARLWAKAPYWPSHFSFCGSCQNHGFEPPVNRHKDRPASNRNPTPNRASPRRQLSGAYHIRISRSPAGTGRALRV